MRIFETVFILTLFLTAQILTGCSSTTGNQTVSNSATNADQKTAAENSKTANDSIEELGMLVNLPFEPAETLWKELPAAKDSANGRVNDRKLMAVLRYSDANAEKLTAQLSRLKSPTAESLSIEEWFPPELIAQGEMSGESTITGKTYAADDFYAAPYLDGKITRIDTTNYFVLLLFTK
jgi:uncharacterized protein YceK